MKPEVLGKDAWPVAVAPLTKMSTAHRDCVLCANRNLTKAIKMGKRVYEKASKDHASFLGIIKQGTAALTGSTGRRSRLKRTSRNLRPPLLLCPTAASSSWRRLTPTRRFESSPSCKRRTRRQSRS